jgi:hypothetical protein
VKRQDWERREQMERLESRLGWLIAADGQPMLEGRVVG